MGGKFSGGGNQTVSDPCRFSSGPYPSDFLSRVVVVAVCISILPQFFSPFHTLFSCYAANCPLVTSFRMNYSTSTNMEPFGAGPALEQIKFGLQGALLCKTVVNTSYFLTTDGTKQIVVGHLIEEGFSTVIKLHKHNAPQNGLVLEPREWDDLVKNQAEIDKYFQRAPEPEQESESEPTIFLGSKEKSLTFRTLYGKNSIIITETSAPPCYYPRQFIIQETIWKYFKSILPAIDSSVKKCVNNERKLKKVFDNIFNYINSNCRYFDDATVSRVLYGMKSTDILNDSFFSNEEFICVFTDLKHLCSTLIVSLILENKIGFNLKYRY